MTVISYYVHMPILFYVIYINVISYYVHMPIDSIVIYIRVISHFVHMPTDYFVINITLVYSPIICIQVALVRSHHAVVVIIDKTHLVQFHTCFVYWRQQAEQVSIPTFIYALNSAVVKVPNRIVLYSTMLNSTVLVFMPSVR